MSRPSSIKLNSLMPVSKVCSLFSGHLNRCFSSLFCQRQNPFLSQYKTLSIVRPRLQKTKRCPENGSRHSLSSTRIDRLLIALRISVLPGARKTRTFAGRFIISAPARGLHAQGLRRRIPCRSRRGSGPLQGKAAHGRMKKKTARHWAVAVQLGPALPVWVNPCVLIFFSNTGSSLS